MVSPVGLRACSHKRQLALPLIELLGISGTVHSFYSHYKIERQQGKDKRDHHGEKEQKAARCIKRGWTGHNEDPDSYSATLEFLSPKNPRASFLKDLARSHSSLILFHFHCDCI